MGCLPRGFNRKNYILPSRELILDTEKQDCSFKFNSGVLWGGRGMDYVQTSFNIKVIPIQGASEMKYIM